MNYLNKIYSRSKVLFTNGSAKKWTKGHLIPCAISTSSLSALNYLIFSLVNNIQFS